MSIRYKCGCSKTQSSISCKASSVAVSKLGRSSLLSIQPKVKPSRSSRIFYYATRNSSVVRQRFHLSDGWSTAWK